MIFGPIKVGIAGTHSTGKSTLVSTISQAVTDRGLAVGCISDLAARAKTLGFPILTQHTYESTLWIMAEGLRQEAEASLSKDVILVDRPPFDALGYLEAALEVSGRQTDPRRLEELRTIAAAHAPEYDLLIVTVLDSSVTLGPGRDQNAQFREAAGRHIARLAANFAPDAIQMTSTNAIGVAKAAVNFIMARQVISGSTSA
jgi:hypothetical protein